MIVCCEKHIKPTKKKIIVVKKDLFIFIYFFCKDINNI